MGSGTVSRLFFPAIVSFAGLGLTQVWYLQTSKQHIVSKRDDSPLAVLSKKNDLVERRPATRIIWERLREGEPLYTGEAVRTGASASGKITFLKSGMSIGLEPDSLVIIEESSGKLQLNLVNGGLFVQNQVRRENMAANEGQPILKAGNKKIEIASGKTAEMNLSVNEAGSANLSVSKGQVKIGEQGGSGKTITEGSTLNLSSSGPEIAILEAKGPKPGASIPITGSNDQLIITWDNAPDGATIFIETGANRESLSRKSSGTPVHVKKIMTSLPSGYFFWRLVAERNGKIVGSSPVVFNQSISLEAPKLITNANGESSILSSESLSVEIPLTWSIPAGSDNTEVVVAKDIQFKSVVSKNNSLTDSDWNVSIKDPGTFYWRVSAGWPGIEKRIFSQVGYFIVTKQMEVPPPVIEDSGVERVHLKNVVDESGLLLFWTGEQGIESYNLKLERQANNSFTQVFAKDLNAQQFKITDLSPGHYRWSVRSRIGDTLSKSAAVAKFRIVDIPKMTPQDPARFKESWELSPPETQFSISLTGVPDHTSKLRFKLAAEPLDLKASNWKVSKSKQQLTFTVSAPGNYRILAEALDQADKTIGLTDILSFTTKNPELLPAPEIPTGGRTLKTGEAGDITLKWNAVTGAVRYLVEINGPNTKVRKEINGTSLKLNQLFPGTHELRVRSIDQRGRLGREGASVRLEVPDVSNIAAPTTKAIKIR